MIKINLLNQTWLHEIGPEPKEKIDYLAHTEVIVAGLWGIVVGFFIFKIFCFLN